jgi:uncharacterized protein YjiS (DUF1127 family)
MSMSRPKQRSWGSQRLEALFFGPYLAFGLAIDAFRLWRRHIRSRQELRSLCAWDDRMLKDIGVTRADIERELARRFWR